MVGDEEEHARERGWRTYLGEQTESAAMAATAAHTRRIAAPGQAKPGHDKRRSAQHHHCDAWDAWYAHHRNPSHRGGVGDERDRRQLQIDMEEIVRCREAVRLSTISSLEMAGGGRNRAATAEAIQCRESEREVRVRSRKEMSATGSVRPSPMGWSNLTSLGCLTGGPKGHFSHFKIPN
jgi:hypothetical protein